METLPTLHFTWDNECCWYCPSFCSVHIQGDSSVLLCRSSQYKSFCTFHTAICSRQIQSSSVLGITVTSSVRIADWNNNNFIRERIWCENWCYKTEYLLQLLQVSILYPLCQYTNHFVSQTTPACATIAQEWKISH